MSSTDPEAQPSSHPRLSSERVPLLSTHRSAMGHTNSSANSNQQDIIHHHIVKFSPSSEQSSVLTFRHRLRHILSSKWGHYFVITLVSLDIAGIFASFLLELHICEHAKDKGFKRGKWENAADVIDAFSLVFSCLFVTELLASVFAFGFAYFNSWFHTFDAFVILLAFVIDVLLHGVLKEAGSLVVVLRLWRVFKIVEEFSSGASDQMEALNEHLETTEKRLATVMEENEGLRLRLAREVPNADRDDD